MILMLAGRRASRSGAAAGLPSREKSPASRYWNGFAAISVISEFAYRLSRGPTGVIVSAIGLARAAAVIAALIFIASSMVNPPVIAACGFFGRPRRSLSCRHCGISRAGLAGQDRAGRLYLLHEVVVPFALDLEVGGSAEFDGLDQVMVDVSVDTGLPERVERSTCRAATNEPGLEILLR